MAKATKASFIAILAVGEIAYKHCSAEIVWSSSLTGSCLPDAREDGVDTDTGGVHTGTGLSPSEMAPSGSSLPDFVVSDAH